MQWYLGDWLMHGENKWGEKYAQVIDVHEQTGIPILRLSTIVDILGRPPP